MPGQNLTRLEAAERARIVSNPRYRVELDLTQGPETFISTSIVEFDAIAKESTFLDLIAPEVISVELNGKILDPETVFADSRIALTNLEEHNKIRVVSRCLYSHTGEGLHRSVDPSDNKIYLYSQFEVADCRRVFAVFDQPDLKGIFSFTVEAPESWIVVSNMPGESTSEDKKTQAGTLTNDAIEGVKKWVFEDTPIMSSYLTGIMAGAYASFDDCATLSSGRKVPMKFFCRQSLKDSLAPDVGYLFDITKKGMSFYDKAWGMEYPYAKYDQIFVPEYNAGAMENIGIVTILDKYIFQSKTSNALKDRRVVTVLHELAHMWFGDLVTMKWWNDLWLNESFAEFMSTLCTAEATNWTDEWATFACGEKSWGQAQDELPTTHPIVAPINDIHDTEVNFDGITYAKGASVLKQLVAYVGRKEFFSGIHEYLSEYAYKNATLNDLLAKLTQASGRDLQKWSQLWLENAGINTLTTHIETDDQGIITSFSIEQTAPEKYHVLRPHRLRIGFYDLDQAHSKVSRSQSIEVDVQAQDMTEYPELVGKKRPDCIIINDEDLTYAKLRFDQKSLDFILKNLPQFDSALTRAICVLTLWDMTRDAVFPVHVFIETMLALLEKETQGTIFRTVTRQITTAAHGYLCEKESQKVTENTQKSLWELIQKAQPGSDAQFQLLETYLTLAKGDEFVKHAQALLSGEITLKDLTIDNNLRWALLIALARAGALTNEQIDSELKKDETTQNREFAYCARASRPTVDTKKWAWNEALTNTALTNSQLMSVVQGFSSADDESLYNPYVQAYFDIALQVWKNRTFHTAESILSSPGLYPDAASSDILLTAGKKWLKDHTDADRALRGIIEDNLDGTARKKRVQEYNKSLQA